MPEYVYDQSFAAERERLAGIERLWDPGTQATMERLGIAPGWRCLEVGAGGGSMVEWMAERVGSKGRVLATDVYTKFLEALELPNVEVREHDILAGEPLQPEFDLVYARLVVEHLGSGALRRMAEAVRPGGILLLEDYDWEAVALHTPQEEFDKVADADALMHSVQAPGSISIWHRVVIQPDGTQLPNWDDAMLPGGNSCYALIGPGAFIGHIPIKAPDAEILPPARARARQ